MLNVIFSLVLALAMQTHGTCYTVASNDVAVIVYDNGTEALEDDIPLYVAQEDEAIELCDFLNLEIVEHDYHQ